jgi:hypothetical protein
MKNSARGELVEPYELCVSVVKIDSDFEFGFRNLIGAVNTQTAHRPLFN